MRPHARALAMMLMEAGYPIPPDTLDFQLRRDGAPLSLLCADGRLLTIRWGTEGEAGGLLALDGDGGLIATSLGGVDGPETTGAKKTRRTMLIPVGHWQALKVAGGGSAGKAIRQAVRDYLCTRGISLAASLLLVLVGCGAASDLEATDLEGCQVDADCWEEAPFCEVGACLECIEHTDCPDTSKPWCRDGSCSQ